MTLGFQWTANFPDLSDDILFILFEFLSLSTLGCLSATCRRLQTLVKYLPSQIDQTNYGIVGQR